jgi:hypothetical protein
VSGVPDFRLDGKSGKLSLTGALVTDKERLLTAINNEVALGSKYIINAKVTRSETKITVQATITTEGTVSIPSKLMARVALIEDLVPYSGGNGQKIHHQALRAIYPDYKGVKVTGAPFDVNAEFDIVEEYNPTNLEIVVFLQDDTSKEILQAWAESVNKPFKFNNNAPQGVTFLKGNETYKFGPVMLYNKTSSPLPIDVSINQEGVPAGWNLSIATENPKFKAPLAGEVTIPANSSSELYIEANPMNIEGSAQIEVLFGTNYEDVDYMGSASYSCISTNKEMLYVDHWNSTAEDYEESKEIIPESLGNLSYYHFIWSDYDGIAGGLNTFKIIFWSGFHSTYTVNDNLYYYSNITAATEELFADYLDNGGNLLISSRWYMFNVYRSDMSSTTYTIRLGSSSFPTKYLGIKKAKITGLVDGNIDPDAAPRRMYGVDGNPISGGFDMVQLDEENTWYCPAMLLKDNTSTSVFTTPDFNEYNTLAISYIPPTGGRVIYTAIPFEAIVDATQRDAFLQKCLTWLKHPMDVQNEKPQIEFKNLTIGPNPFNANLKINFAAPLTEDATLKVFDLQGSMVGKVKIAQGVDSWSIANNKALLSLPTGTYIFKVKSGKDEVAQKLVKLQ